MLKIEQPVGAVRPDRLAVTGLAVWLPGCVDLRTFERLIVNGHPLAQDGDFVPDDLRQWTAGKALQDAGAKGKVIWVDFSGRSTFVAALEQARQQLVAGQADAVLLVAGQAGRRWPDAGAAALVLENRVAAGRRVYAVLEGWAGAPLAAGVQTCCQQALAYAGRTAQDVTYLEMADVDEAVSARMELAGLLAVYGGGVELDCAVGSMGAAGALAGVLALVKAALCLYRRVLPASPSVHDLVGRFYAPADSRAWFVAPPRPRRVAGVNLALPDEWAHVLLADVARPSEVERLDMERAGFYLFPLAGSDGEGLGAAVRGLRARLDAGANLASLARQSCSDWRPEAPYTLAIVARSNEDLRRESDFALKGVSGAFERGADWQTPLGSYFTPQPLGRRSGLAFVYPGAFNSYLGVGRELLLLFPSLHERFSAVARDIGYTLRERLLYPRGRQVDRAQLERLEAELIADPVAMLSSGTSLSVLYTILLRDVFKVTPEAAFGYSLGENSMMFASGVWGDGDAVCAALDASDLFHTRLAGPQNAIRQAWGLPERGDAPAEEGFWNNYILMAEVGRATAAIAAGERVYLTHINAPNQVVIGGDAQACQRVIRELGCNALRAPFNYALHCAAMASEQAALTQLHDWPVRSQPDIRLYSAADYQPVRIERQAIAHSLGRMLSTPLDFPRLTRRVYEDGAGIFVELGAGSNCARWIDTTLKGLPHAAMAIDRRGVEDAAAILGLLGKLCSHAVALDLRPVFVD